MKQLLLSCASTISPPVQMVRLPGLEPGHSCEPTALNRVCLPFQHSRAENHESVCLHFALRRLHASLVDVTEVPPLLPEWFGV